MNKPHSLSLSPSVILAFPLSWGLNSRVYLGLLLEVTLDMENQETNSKRKVQDLSGPKWARASTRCRGRARKRVFKSMRPRYSFRYIGSSKANEGHFMPQDPKL